MVVDQKRNFTSLREGSHGRRSQFQASKMTAYDRIFFATEQTIEKYVVTVKDVYDISEIGGCFLTD